VESCVVVVWSQTRRVVTELNKCELLSVVGVVSLLCLE